MPSPAWIDASPYPADYAEQVSERRSHDTVKRIMAKPTDINVLRGTTFLASQTVRIEGRATSATFGDVQVTNSNTYMRDATVFGVRDHPTLPDLDIKVGDKFGYNDATYRVVGVTLHRGEIQAAAERLQM